MKAETLKKSILQYAMQGKLVAQDPNDEPASELLKRIKAEKEQLIKDGKIKKEKPLPPITADEIPYELPQGWEWVRFSECIDVRDGTHDSPKYQLNGYPFVTSKNLNNGKLDFSNIQYISEEDFKKFSERSYVDNEDILFAMIGSIGNPVIVKKDREFSIKNVALFKKSKFISVKYLYYYLLHIQEILKSNASGAVQSFVSLSTLRTYLFALPPLTEQQRIVEKLEEILPLVEDYGKNEEILSEMNKKLPKQVRQSILQYAVQGKLVEQNPNDEPASELLKRIKAEKEQLIKDGKIKKEKSLAPISEEEIPYELPQGWEFVRLGDIVNYGSTGSVEYSKSLDENMWILDLEDIEKESSRLLVKNRIKTKTFNSTKKLFNKGDILYGKLRPYLDKVIVADEDGVCTTEILPLRPYGNLNPFYIRWVLKNPIFLQYVNQLTYGVKMPRLGTEDGKNAIIPLPPLAEQQRIVAKVEELMKIVDSLKV